MSKRPTLAEWRERALAAEQRVRDLDGQLERAEVLLDRYERWGAAAMSSLDDVVARLLVEEHGPPPHRLSSS